MPADRARAVALAAQCMGFQNSEEFIQHAISVALSDLARRSQAFGREVFG